MLRTYDISASWKTYIVQGISLLFITLFTYAAMGKLLDFENFQVQLGQSPFIGALAGLLAWVVPLVELAIAVLFFFPKWRFLALTFSLVLMLSFTGYIIAVLYVAETVPCSCGGVIASLSWNEHLLFNMGFVLLAVLGIAFSYSSENRKENQNPISNNNSYRT